MTDGLGSWLAFVLLGVYHGINPGMGWLFAVALGLQERIRRAVWGALAPMALGHLGSVALLIAVLIGLRLQLSGWLLRGLAAAVLIGFGLYRLLRTRHPRWVGLQVGFRDLVLWSFWMATGHGAGLMLVPVLLGSPSFGEHSHGVPTAGLTFAVVVAGLHTAAYLGTTGLVAWVVYTYVGVAFLRRAWINLDVLWALVLVLAGLLTLLMG